MDLVEALHSLARQRGRGDSPIVALRSLPARPGTRISHLPISQPLAQAWVTVTGQPFHQHQSLALASLRRGEPLALVGGQSARQTMHLLALELLRAEAPATALLLAPDEPAAAAHRDGLARIVKALGEPLRVGLAFGGEARATMGAQIVVATPAALHERLLRHHARAWSAFWSRLRLIVVAEAHSYDGLAAAHLSALLLRAARLGPGDRPPQLAATIGPVAAADEALAQISGLSWRVIAADDAPAPSAALALWRAGGERARECVALALGLARAGVGVHLTCPAIEVPILRALIDQGAEPHQGISVGPSPLPAAAQLFAGLAGAGAYLQQALDGAALAVLVLGDDPVELALARLAARSAEGLPLLAGPPPVWVAAPGNAYVVAQHLVCAASERPFGAAEVEPWQAATIIPRLEARDRLVGLPGPEQVWQPSATDDDPYAGFDLRGAGSAPAVVRDEQGRQLGQLDQAAFDRWGFVGAALPPGRGGYRVVARDDAGLELTLRSSPEQRRTMPLRRCTVRVRDRRDRRAIRGRELAWGRVVVDEEVYGYREESPGSAPAERALNPPIAASWSAPAIWVDLPTGIAATGQLIGWSLAAALPLRALAGSGDLVPAYDAEARRLYFVDAQPGGNGLAGWLFTALEELLPLAYDVALDCRSDPLLEPLARADMDWLLTLLGGALGATRGPGDLETRRPGDREPPVPLERAGRERAPSAEPPVPSSRAERAPVPSAEPPVPSGRAERAPVPSAEPPVPLERAGRERAPSAESPGRGEPPVPSAELPVPLERGGRELSGREVLGRQPRDEVERGRLAHEAAEREAQERAERERLARAAQERTERERLARAAQEREAQERAERERLAHEAAERAEREQREERAERERLARAASEREAAEREERERLAREAAERAEREAKERAERAAWEAQERAARKAWEEEQRRAREAREQVERETKEREARAREARARAEREAREAKERAEREAREREIREARAAAEKAERERAIREREAQEARERAEKAEHERLAREQAAEEARARAEAAEQARLEREQLAREREAAEQARAERRSQARARAAEAEQVRLERERLARERDAARRATQATPDSTAPPSGPGSSHGRQGGGSPADDHSRRQSDADRRRDVPPRGDYQDRRQVRDPRPPPRQAPPPRTPPPRQSSLPPPPEPARPAPSRADPPRRNAPPPEPEAMPDATAMVERLRKMREQRERQGGRAAPPPPRRSDAPAAPEEARFHAGDQIVCTPYGRGEVVSSRFESDRELLVVDFPDHGRLTIDAAVSAARLVETTPRPPDDDPPL